MQVIAATGNRHKLQEFERIFAPLGIEIAAQSDVCPALAVEETGETFAENAFFKAQAVHRLTGKAAVADDSGLCVDALGGAPGVYSARYGGEDLPHSEKIKLLLKELIQVPDEKRTARFVAHICYIGADGTRIDAEECCEGVIGHAPRGRAASATIRFSWLGIKASQSFPARKRTRYPTGERPCAHLHRSFRRDAGINKEMRKPRC